MTAKSAAQLAEQFVRRLGESEGRRSTYRRTNAAYFDQTAAPSTEVKGVFGDGRAALQPIQSATDALDQRRGAPNIIKAIVDEITTARGQAPVVQVVPQTGSQQDQDTALKRSRILRAQLEQSRFALKMSEIAWFQCVRGDACLLLEPRFPAEAEEDDDPFRPPGIYIQAVDPMDCFPGFGDSLFRHDLKDLMVRTVIGREEARELYGYRTGEETVTVLHCWDDTHKQIMVGEKLVSTIEHNLGFCPAEWARNRQTSGGLAQSDIGSVVDLAKSLQRAWFVFHDSLVWATYPLTVIKNSQNIHGDNIEYGPGAQVSVVQDGDVQFRAPAVNPQAAALIFEKTFDAMLQEAGVSPIRIEGIVDRSNVSGRSVMSQMSPMEARLTASNDLLATSLQRLFAKVLLMLFRLDEFSGHEFPLFGEDNHGLYNDTWTTDDLGGWSRCSVAWDALLGMNRHERFAMATQGAKEGWMHPKEALRAYGIEDPERHLQETLVFHQQMAQAQQQAQGPPPGAAPGGPPGGPPQPGGQGGAPGGPTGAAEQALSIAGGGQGGGPAGPGPVQPPPGAGAGGPPQGAGGPPPGLPNFPPLAQAPSGPGIGVPTGMENPLPAIDAALAPFMARDEIIYREPISNGVAVWVKSHKDIAPVRAALRQTLGGDADIKVRVGPPAFMRNGPQISSSNGSR